MFSESKKMGKLDVNGLTHFNPMFHFWKSTVAGFYSKMSEKQMRNSNNLKNIILPLVFFTHFAGNNRLLDFFIGEALARNELK